MCHSEGGTGFYPPGGPEVETARALLWATHPQEAPAVTRMNTGHRGQFPAYIQERVKASTVPVAGRAL